MKRTIFYSSFIFLFILTACGNTKTSKTPQENKSTNTKSEVLITEFPYPEIPIMYTQAEDRGKFLSEHYWDNLNFGDSSVQYNQDMIEQSWVNWIDLMQQFNPKREDYTSLLKNFYTQLDTQDSTAFRQFYELADKYLYFANSPLRNDKLYIPICEVLLASKNLSDTEKEHINFIYEVIQKNNEGEKVQDFTFTTLTGKKGQLSQVQSNKYILLFFNDPSCNVCAHTVEVLKESPLVNKLIQNKILQIVSINPEDNFEEWKEHSKDFPKEWISGYDKDLTITLNRLYDLRATPSLYLLDKDKKVILKDKALEEILATLEQI